MFLSSGQATLVTCPGERRHTFTWHSVAAWQIIEHLLYFSVMPQWVKRCELFNSPFNCTSKFSYPHLHCRLAGINCTHCTGQSIHIITKLPSHTCPSNYWFMGHLQRSRSVPHEKH